MKINVSIPEKVLKELDEAASEAKMNRSAFLIEALERYLEEKEQEKERERRLIAAKQINKIAEKIGPWNSTEEVLKWRDRH